MKLYLKKIFRRVALATTVTALAAASAAFPVQAQASVIHWGLAFGSPGELPVGNASDEYLAKFNACFHGRSLTEKVIYLTFDAGYENGYTGKILDVLKQNNVPSVFFVVGTYIRDNPELIKRMAAEGHTVGNHTMNHPDITKKDAAGFASQLTDVEALYKSTVGTNMKKFFRPPEGAFSEANLAQAAAMGYKTVLWSVAYADWDRHSQPSREKAFAKLMPRLHPGAIILLHSTSATNAAILPEFIARCREMGYTFKSIDSL